MKPSPPGKGANTDPKIRMMRAVKTQTTYSHGMGGQPRRKGGPKERPTPSLPKLKCLEDK